MHEAHTPTMPISVHSPSSSQPSPPRPAPASTSPGHERGERRLERQLADPALEIRPRSRWYPSVKVVVEWLAALVLFVVALPVLALAGLAVRLTSRGPVIYRQTRIGLHGRTFTLFKLRTMVEHAEAETGPVWCFGDGDPRVTPLGRFLRVSHLDEFPQLVNVLLGQMSLIGPRPERPEMVGKLERSLPLYGDRHVVRPGIAGLAQFNLPADSSLESVRRKLLHDLYYVNTMSPLLDLRILLSTVGLFSMHVGRAVWNLVVPPQESAVHTRMRVVCGRDSALFEPIPSADGELPEAGDAKSHIEALPHPVVPQRPVHPR